METAIGPKGLVYVPRASKISCTRGKEINLEYQTLSNAVHCETEARKHAPWSIG